MSRLQSLVSQIREFAHKYDFDASVPGNGFRSFVKIAERFEGTNEVPDGEKEKVATLLQSIAECLVQLHEVTEQGKTADDKITAEAADLMDKCHVLWNEQVKKLDNGQVPPFWYQGEGKEMLERFMQRIKEMKAKPEGLPEAALNKAKETAHDIRIEPIPTSSEYVIVKEPGVAAKVVKSDFRTQSMISCLIVKPKVVKHADTLLFYTHGGGFCFLEPSLYAPLLVSIAERLGVVIVAPDYRKSPVHKYPAGLQDVLDSYAFFTSKSELVEKLIGFLPKKIVVSGDSAGGNLTISLLIALHMIEKEGGEIQMPTGAHVQYPYSRPGPIVCAASFLELLDPVITVEGISSCVALYVKTEPPVAIDFQKGSTEDRKEQYQLLADHLSDPLFNNLAFNEWSACKNVELVVLVCEFDPLLDMGIELAKKWPKGKAKLRICEGMYHGCVMDQQDVNSPASQELIDDLDLLLKH